MPEIRPFHELEDELSRLLFARVKVISTKIWTLWATLQGLIQLIVGHIDDLAISWQVLNLLHTIDAVSRHVLDLALSQVRVGPLQSILHVPADLFFRQCFGCVILA